MATGAPPAGSQLMLARVGTMLIGVPVIAIARVLPMLPLWRPPTMPLPLAGFVTVASAALPVLDAGLLLGRDPAQAALYAHILELRTAGGSAVGLMVDRAEGFAAPVSLDAVDPDRSLNGCVTALFRQPNGGVGHVVAPERMLGHAEATALATLTQEADRRRAEWEVAA